MRHATTLLVLAIAWGAFSFGAVYDWAYWPLALALTAVASVGLFVPLPGETRSGFGIRDSGFGGRDSGFGIRSGVGALTASSLVLGAAMSAVGTAILLQLVPLKFDLLRSLSPETMRLLGQFDLQVRSGAASTHPTSIAPALTSTALLLFGSMALTMLGTARLLSLGGAKPVAESIVVVGVALALAGIVQQPLFTGKIYGLWTPFGEGSPYGPFVNKNHFAGWMLMALPLALGLLCGGIARAMRGVRHRWRDRLLWFSSPAANRLILTGSAAILMALSLVLTMSRSGIAALALSLFITGIVVLRRQRDRGRKAVAIAYLVFVAVVVVAWVGTEAIVDRFTQTDWTEFNGRYGAWTDASNIFARFPVAGTGLNTYGTATVFYQQHDMEHHYVQAHNDYLQLAAEGGFLVLVPATIALVVFVAAVRRRFASETSTMAYWLRVGAVTGLVAIALQETVEFSLQMPGNAALCATLCGIALHRAPSKKQLDNRVME